MRFHYERTHFFFGTVDDLALGAADHLSGVAVSSLGSADAVLLDLGVGETLGDPPGGDLDELGLLVGLGFQEVVRAEHGTTGLRTFTISRVIESVYMS